MSKRKFRLPEVGKEVTVKLPNDSAVKKGALAHLFPDFIEITGRVMNRPEWETDPTFFVLFVKDSDFPQRHISMTRVVSINDEPVSKYEAEPGVQRFLVKGSKGDEYIVTRDADKWSCNCQGFQYRHHCKHVDSKRN